MKTFLILLLFLSGCSTCPQPAEDPSICVGKFKLITNKGIEI